MNQKSGQNMQAALLIRNGNKHIKNPPKTVGFLCVNYFAAMKSERAVKMTPRPYAPASG